MRKFLTSLVLIIILALAATPFGVGLIAKHYYEKISEHPLQNNEIHLSFTSYHLGWLTSTFTAEVNFTDPMLNSLYHLAEKNGQAPFIIHFTVQHGPVIRVTDNTGQSSWRFGWANADGQMIIRSDLEALIRAQLTKLPVTHCQIFVAFSGDYEINTTVAAIHLNQPGLKLEWGGLTGQATHSTDRYNMQVNSTALKLQNAFNEKFTLSDIESGSQYHVLANGWENSAYLKIPSAEVSAPNLAVNLSDIASLANNQLVDNSFNENFSFSLKKIALNNAQFGPFNVNINFKNLNASAINQLRPLILQQNPITPLQFQQQILPLIVEVFNQDFTANADVDMTAPLGQGKPNTHLTVNTDVAVVKGVGNKGMTINFDKINLENRDYGPGKLVYRIQNFDAESSRVLIKQLIGLNLPALNSNPAMKALAEMQMIPSLIGIFKRGVTAQLDTNIATYAGDSNVHVLIKLLPLAGRLDQAQAQLLGSDVDVNIRLPQQLALDWETIIAESAGATVVDPITALQTAKDKLADYEQKGYLVKDKQDYKFDLSYHQHKLILNSKEIPAAMLLANSGI